MDDGVPDARQARYRLLGLEAVPSGDGILVRRGSVRFRVPGENAGALLDLLVERSAEGDGIGVDDLKAEIDVGQHETLDTLIERLVANRLLVLPQDTSAGESREDIYYWSRGTTRTAIETSVRDIAVAVFGINHIALPLLGNLRSCGFRDLTLVDHPALRNLDFFDEEQSLRGEIAGAISVRLQSLDDWRSGGARPDCQVVCSDFGGFDLMRDWNRTCVAANCLFYPVTLDDGIASLGPLVVPGEGPCLECLWSRRAANLDDGDRVHAAAEHAFFGRAVSGYLQPMARVAADLAATELLKFFARPLGGGTPGQLIEVDLMAPRLRTRHVLKVPRCPVCARAGPARPADQDVSAADDEPPSED